MNFGTVQDASYATGVVLSTGGVSTLGSVGGVAGASAGATTGTAATGGAGGIGGRGGDAYAGGLIAQNSAAGVVNGIIHANYAT